MSAALLAALLLLSIPALAAGDSPTNDVTAQFANAGFRISGLRAFEVGGIVVLRGKTTEPAEIERVAAFAHTLGYQRVANVVALTEPADDAAIERRAERTLAAQRSLDGCTFHIDSQDGIVRVAGHVQFELQKDVAIDLLRNVDGVREVHAELQR